MRRYLALLGLLAVAVAAPCIMSVAFLWRAGELDAYARTAAAQQRTGAVWGSATNGDVHRYKLELVKARPGTKVLVMGSSRVLELREKDFLAPATNVGSSMSSLTDGKEFLANLLPSLQPDVLVLGLDPWWFNADMPEDITAIGADRAPQKVTRDKILAPYSWLAEGKISLADVAGVLIHGHPGGRTGVAALTTGKGFLPDGSRATLQVGTPDPGRFDEAVKQARGRTGRFRAGHQIADRMVLLEDVLAMAKQHGVRVVLYLALVSPAVAEELRRGGQDFSYIAELQRGLATLSVEYYDFYSPSDLNADPAEFTDGIHMTERLEQRILRTIAVDRHSTILGPLVDVAP